ncbi:carbohydrate kinase family protein [archaeon]|nr:carbohydrate kinase family protein [archaeon]
MFDVITVGSNTLDVFVDTEAPEIKKKGEKLITYPVGSKVLIKDTHFSTGGGGTNTAVSFSRAGLKTGYIGKVGTGDFSRLVLDMLEKENVAFLGATGSKANGYSVILESKNDNRTILTHKGENNNLGFNEINKKKLKTKWFYFSSMMGRSFNAQKRMASYASKNGIKIGYNPSSYQTSKGLKHLKPILAKTEVLVLNSEEAGMLVKKEPLKGLREAGPRIVCITKGKEKVTLYNGEHKYTLTPHNVKAKERTGAGDAFASTLIAGLIKGEGVEKSMQLGLANAESVIMDYGATENLLSWKELKKRVKKKPAKIVKEAY